MNARRAWPLLHEARAEEGIATDPVVGVAEDRRRWFQLLRETLDVPPLTIDPRLLLFDAAGEQVVGRPESVKRAVLKPIDSQGRRGVFLVRNGQAVFRGVTLGLEEPDRIEVIDGLTEGDEVVTTGASGLRDGAQVLLATSRSGNGTQDSARKTVAAPRTTS